jgi:hypothetical protein
VTYQPNGPRAAEYAAHPVPHGARAAAHIGQWFDTQGTKEFSPRTNGREIAAELTRGLHPSARRMLLEKGDT